MYQNSEIHDFPVFIAAEVKANRLKFEIRGFRLAFNSMLTRLLIHPL